MYRLRNIALLMTLLFFTTCSKNTHNNDNRPLVGTFVAPYSQLLIKIADPYIRIVNVVESNQIEESTDISAKKMELIKQAKFYFSTGFPLEKMLEEKNIIHSNNIIHLDQIVEKYNFQETVDFSNNIKHEGHQHNMKEIDPHFWMGPLNMIRMIKKSTEIFVSLDPVHTEFFSKNAAYVIKKIKQVYSKLRKKANLLKNKKILVFHPSLGYFAKELGLTQIAIESEGKEPSLKELANIIALIKKENISTLFLQAQYSKDVLLAIQKETNISIVIYDPLSADYIGELKKLESALR